MKSIKLILLIAGVCIIMIAGMAFFADKFGYNISVRREFKDQNTVDFSGTYRLAEMCSIDGKYVTLNVVQVKNDQGEKIEPVIVYTVGEVPLDYNGDVAYTWLEGTMDFCTNSSLGYYKYVYSEGSWIVYERQDDYSLAPLY